MVAFENDTPPITGSLSETHLRIWFYAADRVDLIEKKCARFWYDYLRSAGVSMWEVDQVDLWKHGGGNKGEHEEAMKQDPVWSTG